MWNPADEQPVVLERRIELHGFEKVVRGGTGKDRESIDRLRHVAEVLIDALGIAVEALAGVVVQRPATLEPGALEKRVVAALTLVVDTQVEVQADYGRINLFKCGQTVELFAKRGF